jgi:hypothetical protein
MSNSNNFNINGFNNLIKVANESISCGPSCMQQQNSNQLQQNYLDAETNMINAPQKLFVATKDLITYTKGEAGYNAYIDDELQKKAEAIVNSFESKFNANINTITGNLKNYQGLLINFENIFDLYKKYKNENDTLEKKLKIINSDMLTNDRKTYYEDEGLKRLTTYYYFFLFIYIFILVVFILSIFLVKTNIRLITRIFILFLLILYPFISYCIVLLLHKFFNYIKKYNPKNVYINL